MWNRPSTPFNAVPQYSSRIQMKSSRATQRKSPTTKCLAVLRTQDRQRGSGAWQEEGAASSVSKYWRTTTIHHCVQDQHPSRSPTANSILTQQWRQRTRCRRNMQGTVHERDFERVVKLEVEQLCGGNRSGEHKMERICQDRIAGEDLRLLKRKPAQPRSVTSCEKNSKSTPKNEGFEPLKWFYEQCGMRLSGLHQKKTDHGTCRLRFKTQFNSIWSVKLKKNYKQKIIKQKTAQKPHWSKEKEPQRKDSRGNSLQPDHEPGWMQR